MDQIEKTDISQSVSKAADLIRSCPKVIYPAVILAGLAILCSRLTSWIDNYINLPELTDKFNTAVYFAEAIRQSANLLRFRLADPLAGNIWSIGPLFIAVIIAWPMMLKHVPTDIEQTRKYEWNLVRMLILPFMMLGLFTVMIYLGGVFFLSSNIDKYWGAFHLFEGSIWWLFFIPHIWLSPAVLGMIESIILAALVMTMKEEKTDRENLLREAVSFFGPVFILNLILFIPIRFLADPGLVLDLVEKIYAQFSGGTAPVELAWNPDFIRQVCYVFLILINVFFFPVIICIGLYGVGLGKAFKWTWRIWRRNFAFAANYIVLAVVILMVPGIISGLGMFSGSWMVRELMNLLGALAAGYLSVFILAVGLYYFRECDVPEIKKTVRVPL
jgi:hypothetical protein